MRKVKAKIQETNTTYEDAITTIPNRVMYEGYLGKVDITQACCWICEKVLSNGMGLVHIDSQKRISTCDIGTSLVSEGSLLVGGDCEGTSLVSEDCLLVCGDCEAALKQSEIIRLTQLFTTHGISDWSRLEQFLKASTSNGTLSGESSSEKQNASDKVELRQLLKKHDISDAITLQQFIQEHVGNDDEKYLQDFIYDPDNPKPKQVAEDPFKSSNFILPNSDEHKDKDAFIYTKKAVFVRQISRVKEDGGDKSTLDDDTDMEESSSGEGGTQSSQPSSGQIDKNNKGEGSDGEGDVDREVIISQRLESHIIVEPNPTLSKPNYIRAQNTINLFCLNGRSFKPDSPYPAIDYVNQSPYDDLRLVARKSAYEQARKALKQVKTLKARQISNDLLQTLIDQYKILLELTGFFSTWQQVFDDGNDPDTFKLITAPDTPLISPSNRATHSLQKQNKIFGFSAKALREAMEEIMNEPFDDAMEEGEEEEEKGVSEEPAENISEGKIIKPKKGGYKVKKIPDRRTPVAGEKKRKRVDPDENIVDQNQRRQEIDQANPELYSALQEVLNDNGVSSMEPPISFANIYDTMLEDDEPLIENKKILLEDKKQKLEQKLTSILEKRCPSLNEESRDHMIRKILNVYFTLTSRVDRSS